MRDGSEKFHKHHISFKRFIHEPIPTIKTIGWNFKKNRWAYIFLSVTILVFLLFMVYPVVKAIMLSFQELRVFGDDLWVGLDNYSYTLSDSLFWLSLKNTAIFTLFTVPLGVGSALILATLLHPMSEKVKSFFRAAYYLPGVASGVVMGMVWRYLFDPNYGLFNYFLVTLGLPKMQWLASPDTALGSIILMGFLMAPGFAVILYLSNMKNIPKSYYESADLDGAGSFRKWWNITVPLVKPTTLYLLVTSSIGALQVFTQMYVMTQGGPGYSTYSIVYLIYRTGFFNFDYGLASSQAIILFIIIIILSIVQFKYLSSDIEY